MLCLGIVNKNSIEMVDVKIDGSTIVPGRCPRGRASSCDRCPCAQLLSPASRRPGGVMKARNNGRTGSLILCHWYEQQARS